MMQFFSKTNIDFMRWNRWHGDGRVRRWST